MSIELKVSLLRLKASILFSFFNTAKVNEENGDLDPEKGAAIREACDEIMAGKWPDEFPLVVYQTGSGTQSNMSMNNFFRHFSADFEIFEGALRLSTPHMIRRYADFAK